MGRVFAAVDIGSNTVHLLVADVQRHRIRRIANDSEWLGLGERVTREGSIGPELLAELVASLQRFKQIALNAKAERMYIFATEAVRRASDGAEVMTHIERLLKLKVEVVTGEREAALGLRGALIDCRPHRPFALAEVGGGSAQIARCDSHGLSEEISLPVGTGRLTGRFGLQLPCSTATVTEIDGYVAGRLGERWTFDPVKDVVASGGVARGLVRALHPDGDRVVHQEEIEYLLWSCPKLTVEQTSLRFGVKQKRAATLLLGAVVFRRMLNHLGVDRMTVSEYGVREGAILEMDEGKI